MDKGSLIFAGIIGVVGGAITALCLRPFTTLPVLVTGGIIGAGAFATLAAFIAIDIYLTDEKSLNKDDIPPMFVMCATSVAIGVGLTAALTPAIFAKWNTAIVAGAAIGAIGLVGGCLALEFFIAKSEKEPDQSLTGPNPTAQGINVTGRSAEPHRT